MLFFKMGPPLCLDNFHVEIKDVGISVSFSDLRNAWGVHGVDQGLCRASYREI